MKNLFESVDRFYSVESIDDCILTPIKIPIGKNWASNQNNPFIKGTRAYNESFNDGMPVQIIMIPMKNSKTGEIIIDPATGLPKRRPIEVPISINATAERGKTFGDRVDIPSLYRRGTGELVVGVGHLVEIYEVPVSNYTDIKLDYDMMNAVFHLATVTWLANDWALTDEKTDSSTGRRYSDPSMGGIPFTKTNIGVAFLRRVAGPSVDAPGNIEKIDDARADFLSAIGRGGTKPVRRNKKGEELPPYFNTSNAPSVSRAFWDDKAGGLAGKYITSPPREKRVDPMARVRPDPRTVGIDIETVRDPGMSAESFETSRIARREDRKLAKAAREQADDPFLSTLDIMGALASKKKKTEPLPPSADTQPPGKTYTMEELMEIVPGDKVVVLSGPFKDFVGDVISLRGSNDLEISIDTGEDNPKTLVIGLDNVEKFLQYEKDKTTSDEYYERFKKTDPFFSESEGSTLPVEVISDMADYLSVVRSKGTLESPDGEEVYSEVMQKIADIMNKQVPLNTIFADNPGWAAKGFPTLANYLRSELANYKYADLYQLLVSLDEI